MLFEGGDSSSLYEGGSGDEDIEDAQSIKPKKKGKKKAKKADTFKSDNTITPKRVAEDSTPNNASMALDDTSNALVVDDLDIDSIRTKGTKKSVTKKKKKKSTTKKFDEDGGVSP